MPARLRPLAPLAALLLLPVSLGCSSSHASSTAPSACSALETCCASLSGEEATSCQDALAGATSSACASTLAALVQAGGCTTEGFDAGSTGPGVDGGVPCAVTGTCPGNSSSSSGGPDGGAAPPSGPECVTTGACDDGTSYSTCMETSASGTCNAAVVFENGETFPCASCGNCVSATLSAQSYCSTTTTSAPDAGPDTGSTCGTAPVLHPETTPGVYCPFTEAGSVHCAAGQECCETPTTVTNGSTCQAAGVTCPVAGSLAWGCNGPVDCQGNAAGSVCCAAGTVAPDPVCGFDRGTGLTGSYCAASCASNEVEICASATDPCPTGTQCTPFKVAGVVLGTCL